MPIPAYIDYLCKYQYHIHFLLEHLKKLVFYFGNLLFKDLKKKYFYNFFFGLFKN